MEMQEPIEEEYMDVLQNIEVGIMSVYREHPELTDWEALEAIEALIRHYRAEASGRKSPRLRLPGLAKEVFERVQFFCEWRLGREVLVDEEGNPVPLQPEPIPLEDLIACLKRIRSSIKLWNKQGGRQGYLNFVSQFIW